MSANKPIEMISSDPIAGAPRRRVIRYVAAVLSAATAVVYFLIGFRVVSVLDGNADQTWGFVPAIAYAFGALLLLVFDRRIYWVLGVVLQVFVIFTYFNLASTRMPAFELWGILIRMVQLMLVIALAYLAFRPPEAQETGWLWRQT